MLGDVLTAGRQDEAEGLTVGQVAQQHGITVRTLHHYDGIGLVRPSKRTNAGYRVYTADDVERLAMVVLYRRLGFTLEQIADLLDGSEPVVDHLRRQRAAVLRRIDEMTDLISSIETMMEAEMSERPATSAELRELFGDGFDDEYAREAEERWGDSDAWAESQARTRAYGTGDWQALKDESDAINATFVAAMEAGEPASSQAAMDAAEAARRQIDERFYPCSPQFHRSLADMYVSDPRFTATYEKIRPGLAQYVRDAVFANADRQVQQGG